MKLSRIHIEQFKQFREAVEIADLDAGINLFTGPNETGKSTIVSAIRAAFFERHRSSSVDHLRPWGDASASPTVEIEFVVADTPYKLTKSFLGKKRCELQAGARLLDGAAAEDHLADLLGFQYAGRGASAAEHWGIPGLLWIQQGAAQDIKDSVTYATDHLRTALNESLGEVASSGGDEVLSIVEAVRNELLTPATGAAKGPLADTSKREAEIVAALRALDLEIGTYRQKVDALASMRREHAADEFEKPWLTFRVQEQEALGKLHAIDRVQTSLAADRQRATQVNAQADLLRSQLDNFTSQEVEVQTRSSALSAAEKARSSAAGLVERWKAKVAEAAERHEAARSALRLARQEDTRRSLTRQLEDLKLKADAAASALASAEAEQTNLLDLQRQSAASEIAGDDLTALRNQQREIRELQIQRASAATRLQFTVTDGRSIQVGNEQLSGSGERLLLESTTVLLPGLGQLEISPGGANLAELGRKERELTDSQAALLQRMGLPSLDAAEARHQTHVQRLALIKTATATLKALAPKGVDAIRAEHASHVARAVEVDKAIDQLMPAPPMSPAVPTVSVAETAEDATKQALEQINASLNQAHVAAGNNQTAFEAAARELAAAQAFLNQPDRATRVATANESLVDALAEQGVLAARIETLVGQVNDSRPDILRQDVDRFRKSAEQHEHGFSERKTKLMRLEVELEAAGAQGLEERRAELARDLAQVQRRVEELRRRAVAADHLLRLLRAKRSALTRKLQAPLQKHLNRYLQLLFPTANLEIDEDLTPGPLTRTGTLGAESGAFEALSFGAREQMGVISRLAYADLLKEAGRPTLVILDDALVHSDDERLALMKRVLFDAATRHQILLFTCHPMNWRDLGVTARPLNTIRADS